MPVLDLKDNDIEIDNSRRGTNTFNYRNNLAKKYLNSGKNTP